MPPPGDGNQPGAATPSDRRSHQIESHGEAKSRYQRPTTGLTRETFRWIRVRNATENMSTKLSIYHDRMIFVHEPSGADALLRPHQTAHPKSGQTCASAGASAPATSGVYPLACP